MPPPEDTRHFPVGSAFASRPSHIAFHLGGGPLQHGGVALGVDRVAVKLSCGVQQLLVEVWIAPLSTPAFTVDAYDTSFVFASLARQDIDSAQKFSNKLKAIVSLDGSDEVRVYATYLGVPVFEGPDALYWCLRHRVSE